MNTREIPQSLLDNIIELAREAYRQMPLDQQDEAAARVEREPRQDFQARCQAWLDIVTAGDPTDRKERIARFMEESLELVQSLGMTEDEVRQLVFYVFGRPAGIPRQEFGGVATTLAVLAEHTGHDLLYCGEVELARCWKPEVIEKIRGKRSRRHGRGPLPGTTEADLVPESSSGRPRAQNDFRYTD